MMIKRSLIKREISLAVKGMFIGIAFVIPGVSAGTMALVSGLYIPLIDFINILPLIFVRKKNVKELYFEFSYLFSVFLGVVGGFFLTIHWMTYFIKDYPIAIYSFFSGLILASMPFLYKRMKKRIINFIILILSALFVFFLSSFQSLTFSGYAWLIFSVYVGVGAMLLPGISGSYILVLMGSYLNFLQIFKNFSFQTVGIIFVALLSLFTFSKWIQYLLKNYLDKMMAFLTGMTLGGVLGIFPLKTKIQWEEQFIVGILFFVIGFAIYLLVDQLARGVSKSNARGTLKGLKLNKFKKN